MRDWLPQQCLSRALALPTLLLTALALPAVGQARAVGQVTTADDFTVFAGRVVGADAQPVAGAIVVTSAGGEAVTDADGRFRVEAGLPAAAERVRLSAVWSHAGRSFVGSADVAGLVRRGVTPAGTISLGTAGRCQAQWLPTFGGLPGTDDAILALAVHDAGTGRGPALYLGGEFTYAGGLAAHHVARWDGSDWETLGGGVDGPVHALASFDDGSGPALYAGGDFTLADGAPVGHVARWDGARWTALGSGLDFAVRALAVYDDGGPAGPLLVAAGGELDAVGPPARVVAAWDGTAWTHLGGSVNGAVLALAVVDGIDGAGPELYAGGEFTSAAGVTARHVMRLQDGATWAPVAGGTNGTVHALAGFDDGGGTALYAGGEFTSASGTVVQNIAAWNGTGWAAPGSWPHGPVRALAAWDEGSGSRPALYVGCWGVTTWDGASWAPVGGTVFGDVHALARLAGPRGETTLYAGGRISGADGHNVRNLAAWDGKEWLPPPAAGLNAGAAVMHAFDDGLGRGPALFVGGLFTTADGAVMNKVGKWDGGDWTCLDGGVGGVGAAARSMAVFDDGQGGGPALYVGGILTSAGGEPMDRIAKWDGTQWWLVGSGFSTAVEVLHVHDDGSGPALYAGGTANYVSKWQGGTWTILPGVMSGTVVDMVTFDDGGGPLLYVATSIWVRSWDGTTWSTLPLMNGKVLGLQVHDDGSGSGPALYAGGTFTTAGGVPANRVARWDGAAWSPVGSGVGEPGVGTMAVFDDGCGSGPALYAGGAFATAGGFAANSIAKWDGTAWSPLESGVDYTVWDLSTFPVRGAGGDALIASGNFTHAFDSGDAFLAAWGRPASGSAWVDLGQSATGATGGPRLAGRGALLAGTPGALTLTGAAPHALAHFVLSGSNAPTRCAGGTLVPGLRALTVAAVTSPAGEAVLAWPAWPDGFPGAGLYVQCVVHDPSAACGVTLSNALRADVPGPAVTAPEPPAE